MHLVASTLHSTDSHWAGACRLEQRLLKTATASTCRSQLLHPAPECAQLLLKSGHATVQSHQRPLFCRRAVGMWMLSMPCTV